MVEDTRIVEYKVEDVDESVKQLWIGLAKEMFEIAHSTLPSETNGDTWVRFVREGLTKGTGMLLVAKNRDQTVGFAYSTIFHEFPLEIQEPFATINDLYVLPGFREKGIGRRLMNECVERIRAKGFNIIRLNVLREDKAALKLYKKLGFNILMYGMIKAFEH